MKLHPKVTVEMLMDAIDRQRFGLDNPGFCLACGAEADGCEPDARKHKCECCGEPQVYGAEELFLMFI